MSWCHIYYITSVILYIFSGYVTTSEYYVSADPNGVPCPHTHLPCHNLSYYTTDYESYFTDDTIFYFLEGTHTLQGTLEISGVSNVTLQGLGHIEQGFHETITQSTSVIRCSGCNGSDIQFTNSMDIVLKSLTIASYEFNLNVKYSNSLVFTDINNVTLEWVSVQNSSGNGLILYNTFDVLIINSSFANNGCTQTNVGTVLIYYDDQVKKLSRVNIVKSSFTLSLGSCMNLVYYVDNEIEIEVIIENSQFSHNIVQYGGGVYIYINNGGGSIEFSNCTIYNNFARNGGGGGVSIELNNGSGSIEFSNCTIYNNNASNGGGGGVLIELHNGSGSTEFSNCTIYNNNAWNGGGVLIELHNGNGSIEFSNCTIYNNNAWNGGGGVYIDLHNGSGSIEFSDCTIYNNALQYGSKGGGMLIELHNGSSSIEFSNCTIYNNIAWDGGGGGVYIDLHYGSGSTEFSNCAIYNNFAWNGGGVLIELHNGSGSTVFSNCTIYNNNVWNGGGGVLIKLNNGSDSIEFSNCTIYSNSALYGGGGVSIELHNGSGSTEFSNCTIYSNSASYGGGGVSIELHNGSGSTEFSNCTIYSNKASYGGGGVSIELHNGSGSTEFSNCTIYNNIAYYGSGLIINALEFTSTSSIHFTNVSFQFNHIPNMLDMYQSALLLMNIENVVFDQIDISNHNTTGLLSINSQIIFDGHSTFINNCGINGGGIALYAFSQLLLKQNTNITFVNNYASESGGGIFVSQIIDNIDMTNCPFKDFSFYDNYSKTTLYFINNTADTSGDVLYGGKISSCANFDFDHQFHYPQQRGLSAVSSDPIQVCFCESNRQNCSITNINITAIPGINVNISLATVGNKDGLTKGVIKLTTSDSSSSTLQTDNIRLNATCTNVIFKLRVKSSLNTTQVYVRSEGLINRLIWTDYVKIIEVSIGSCPIGFPLVNDTCVCRSELNTSSITCDINTQIVTRDGDMWIGYQNDSDCLIVYPLCPFDYCYDGKTQFKITSPDPQCLHNRSGILCGQCTKGLSLMLGSNQCGKCTNNYLALIIPFALAGIALVAFIIALNLTVSVGTINGLIFYANVVKIYEPIFFPNGPVKLLSQFISWLNLDLGIETCFIDGLDSCSKAWLQFIFPGYVWFLLIIIVISSQYSSKVVRLMGSHAVQVLATMILLSYTKLIRTVFQALYFINIQCNGNNNVALLRWYIDANVQYVGGYCHLPLFMFSLAVLILLIVPYTLYLITIPLFEGPLSKYMCCCQKLWIYMKPFFDAYGGPYKDKCRFWTGFLLLVRVVLALVVSLDIEATISLDVLTSLLFLIISMYFLLRGIYRHLPLACLEMSFFLNLMFMAYVNVQTYKVSNSRQVLSVALVSVSFVVFCGIIIYHVWDHLSKSCLKQPIAKIMRVFKKTQQNVITDDSDVPLMYPGSPALICDTSSVTVVSVVMRRESLLDDEDD